MTMTLNRRTMRKQNTRFLSTEDPFEIFQLLDLLGEGSYGCVYKAVDQRDGENVAVKIIPVENDISELQKEIAVLRKCKSSHIVNYRGSYIDIATPNTWKWPKRLRVRDEKSNSIWIVMEYCGAGSVIDLMSICRRTMTEEQIAIVCRETLFGLQYLHSQRLIHRDVKAGNILLTPEGHTKLADFGVSAQLTESVNKRRTVIGTPYWMAPEVLQETDYNYKADIWSLGVTAIEMATGDPPHADVHPMRAIFKIPSQPAPRLPNRADGAEFSDNFKDFVAQCCIKNPDLRKTADELLKHPFIRNAKSKIVLQELVHECLPEIEEFRKEQTAEATAHGTESASGTAVFGSNTMVLSSKQTTSRPGTIVRRKDGKTDKRPDYMEHFMKKTGTVTSNGTDDSYATMRHHTDASEDSEAFMDYFRSGRDIEYKDDDSLLNLRGSLNKLNVAYQHERDALDDFYQTRRDALRRKIQTKEKEELQAALRKERERKKKIEENKQNGDKETENLPNDDENTKTNATV